MDTVTLGILLSKIKKMQNAEIPQEQIKTAIEKYLLEHPISDTATLEEVKSYLQI